MSDYTVSVRTMVESVLIGGDIMAGGSVARMLEGARGHRRLQGQAGDGARSEVSVSAQAQMGEIRLTVQGRIDLLWMEGEIPSCIDEIKTVRGDPSTIGEEDNPLHWAQAECYAHMLCLQYGLDHLSVRLTYLKADSDDIARMTRELSAIELARCFDLYAQAYLTGLAKAEAWAALRDASLNAAAFPYVVYRPGQREMAQRAYIALRDGQRLLAEAPTGIGKSAAMLFAALKAMGQGHLDKIFYLTARGTTQQAARDALERMTGAGLRVRSITLSAKDKMCACPGSACHPDDCERARGHYDRFVRALDIALADDTHTPQSVRDLCDAHTLCPFEFALDLSLHCDVVIGDYNYAFDPRAKLRRYFLEKSRSALLIDEAHNLPDRAREMFSAAVSRKGVEGLRRDIGRISRRGVLYKATAALAKALKAAEEPGERALADFPGDVWECIDAFLNEAGPVLSEGQPYGEPLAELFFEVLALQTARENLKKYPQDFLCLCQPPLHRLYCLSPAQPLRACYAMSRAQVLFSATLRPFDYYAELCGLDGDGQTAAVPSPFPPERLRAIVHPVSTRYRDRQDSAPAVADAIAAMACGKPNGNYIAFFPSYAYLRLIEPLLTERMPSAHIAIQTGGMDEAEREEFLMQFDEAPNGVLLALAVMGGLFGEGVDLPGERLSGAAIVGVGLPQIGLERDSIQGRYGDNGFAYAYAYPGIARVAQAGGRVIRSEMDSGVVLLIDDRFLRLPYRPLLPRHWEISVERSALRIGSSIQEFWQFLP